MDQSKVIEFLTEEQCGTRFVRKSDSRGFPVIEREFGVEVDRLFFERIPSVEHDCGGPTVLVVLGGDLPEFVNDRRWDDDSVSSQTDLGESGIVVSDNSVTDESGEICEEL